jgi:hypothetical protein
MRTGNKATQSSEACAAQAVIAEAPPQRTRGTRTVWPSASSVSSGGGDIVRAQFQMPDPKQMSGIPRPVGDLLTAASRSSWSAGR